ncbi:CbtB domain-containing protein [Devosia sp.]|uniref:CbtB domain-containing protein n=1 Tax=Devosia sp. TaxID=1871048 RepID=UPI002EF1D328
MHAAVHTTTIASLSLSQRLVAGLLALLMGLALVGGVGFAGDMAVHNGAHDTRHALGFPCH